MLILLRKGGTLFKVAVGHSQHVPAGTCTLSVVLYSEGSESKGTEHKVGLETVYQYWGTLTAYRI